MIIDDWAHAAYEAARRHDVEGMYAVLTELARNGRAAMDIAMRNWVDRTLSVMTAAGDDPYAYRLLEMEADDSGTGEAEPMGRLPREVAWAGRMFMARARHDRAMWDALWDSLPKDPETVTEHMLVLLTTMTTTAAAYADNVSPNEAPRTGLAGWIRGNPETAAARIALAHLN